MDAWPASPLPAATRAAVDAHVQAKPYLEPEPCWKPDLSVLLPRVRAEPIGPTQWPTTSQPHSHAALRADARPCRGTRASVPKVGLGGDNRSGAQGV